MSRCRTRCTSRRHRRSVVRPTVRVRWRVPDDLGEALTCYRLAIRARRRLARLAPRFFDPVVIERERREREARRRWMDLWEPHIARAYGAAHQPPKPTVDQPPLPPPRTQRAVERQLAAWDHWLAAGQLALDRHHQRRPHALVKCSRLALLYELAFDFGRLASGQDPTLEDPDLNNHDAAWADLKRAYGHLRTPKCESSSIESTLA